MVFPAQIILTLCMGSIINAIGSTIVTMAGAAILAFLAAMMSTQVVYQDLWQILINSWKLSIQIFSQRVVYIWYSSIILDLLFVPYYRSLNLTIDCRICTVKYIISWTYLKRKIIQLHISIEVKWWTVLVYIITMNRNLNKEVNGGRLRRLMYWQSPRVLLKLHNPNAKLEIPKMFWVTSLGTYIKKPW